MKVILQLHSRHSEVSLNSIGQDWLQKGWQTLDELSEYFSIGATTGALRRRLLDWLSDLNWQIEKPIKRSQGM